MSFLWDVAQALGKALDAAAAARKADAARGGSAEVVSGLAAAIAELRKAAAPAEALPEGEWKHLSIGWLLPRLPNKVPAMLLQ